MWVIFAVITACSGVFAETGNVHAGYVTVAMIYLYNAAHNLGWTGAMMLYGETIISYVILRMHADDVG